jgi:hypothetical protein
MQYLPLISLSLAVLALFVSLTAHRRASTRFAKSLLRQKISELDLDIVELADRVDQLTKLAKRQNARAAMAKAREKKKSADNGEMTDEEWRTWATKRIQLKRTLDD